MKKDAYHFPHFCNARHDRKIRRIRKELGIEGYGIFFMLLEVLREQTDFKYPVEDMDLLADEFGTSPQKVEIIIKKYDLFNMDKEGKFFSTRLLLYLQPYFERSEKARLAANKRWDNAQAMLKHSPSNAQAMQVKESKVKNSKRKDFDFVWQQYPKRVGKKNAQRHFNATVNTKKDLENIQLALNNYKKSKTVKKGLVQNGSTWFNQWEDWLELPETEKFCEKCRGKGYYTSVTGYKVNCKCKEGQK